MDPLFVGAGFDCARLEWHGNLCLLDATGHTPERNMRAHYEILRAHGIRHVRDGLPWWLPVTPRLKLARELGLEVVWDLDHYWRHSDPERYAERIAFAVRTVCPDAPLWCCFNETWLAGVMTPGQGTADVIAKARIILRVLRANLYDVRVVTAEPAHSPGEIEAHAPFADEAVALGLNFYPQHVDWSIGDALRAMARRYPGKPLMVTETGLHPGLERKWRGIDCKGAWLAHVLDEIETVRAEGVPVERAYLYPIVNTPSWKDPTERWDHGLIREDLSVDPALSAAIMAATGAGKGHWRPDGARQARAA